MIKTTNKKKSYQINYETEWKHDHLEPNERLYFAPNTPVEEVVFQLQDHQNRLYPDSNVNHSRSIQRFNRLYRNIISDYKGWQVSYRKPNSKDSFGPITEKIGFKPKSPKRSLKPKIFKTKMRWTHELYPLVEIAEIKKVASYKTIATQLNKKIEKPAYQSFFKRLSPYFEKVSHTYNTLYKKSLSIDCQTKDQSTCQMFCENVQNLYRYYKPMHLLMTKDYLVQGSNISDVLQKKTNQSAKGWRV